jgi:hypothetical protein
VNIGKDKLCTASLEEMVFFKTGIKVACILLASIEGAKPMRFFNEWAEKRGRAAIVREWGMISPESKKYIVDMWEKGGSISKVEANKLLNR